MPLGRIAYAVGLVACLATLSFVVWAFAAQASRINELGLLNIDARPIAISAVLYALSLVTTAMAWPILVSDESRGKMGQLALIGLGAQAGKYVPGNFAHYLGRAALARRQAIGFDRSAGTTIVELATSIAAGMIVGIVALTTSREAAELATRHATKIQLLVAAVILVFAWFVRRERRPVLILTAIALFSLSFVLAGGSLFLASVALIEALPLDPGFAIAAFAFAWIAGFVVPGAPAGLGIREAVLIALLAPPLGAAHAVFLATLHRFITIGVDLGVAATASWLLWRRFSNGSGHE